MNESNNDNDAIQNMLTDLERIDAEFDIFMDMDIDLDDEQINNNRVAIRYIRKDITAFIAKTGLLRFSEKKLPVQLLDISTKGATIACQTKLAHKTKLRLYLHFVENKTFEIPAQVIHKHNIDSQIEYGLRFNRLDNELGDYMVQSQNKLEFK